MTPEFNRGVPVDNSDAPVLLASVCLAALYLVPTILNQLGTEATVRVDIYPFSA